MILHVGYIGLVRGSSRPGSFEALNETDEWYLTVLPMFVILASQCPSRGHGRSHRVYGHPGAREEHLDVPGSSLGLVSKAWNPTH